MSWCASWCEGMLNKMVDNFKESMENWDIHQDSDDKDSKKEVKEKK